MARNGKEALECLSRVPEIELVIMDIMMPGINELELLAKVKRTPEWKDIPVIMCSSLANAETIRKAMCMGSKYYLMKPIDPKMMASQKVEKPPLPRWERACGELSRAVGVRVNKAAFQILTSPSP